jgi:hypothetical protein
MGGRLVPECVQIAPYSVQLRGCRIPAIIAGGDAKDSVDQGLCLGCVHWQRGKAVRPSKSNIGQESVRHRRRRVSKADAEGVDATMCMGTHRSPVGSVTRNAMCVKVVSSSGALFHRTLQSSRATFRPSASSAIASNPFIWKQLHAHT